jgi:hypothetical protein
MQKKLCRCVRTESAAGRVSGPSEGRHTRLACLCRKTVCSAPVATERTSMAFADQPRARLGKPIAAREWGTEERNTTNGRQRVAPVHFDVLHQSPVGIQGHTAPWCASERNRHGHTVECEHVLSRVLQGHLDNRCGRYAVLGCGEGNKDVQHAARLDVNRVETCRVNSNRGRQDRLPRRDANIILTLSSSLTFRLTRRGM